MVSISRKRIKSRRRRTKQTQTMVAAGMLLGLLFVAWNFLALSFLPGDTNTLKSKLVEGNNELHENKNRFQHPNLHVNARNSEQFNAVAKDILRTLDCAALFNRTKLMDEEDEYEYEQAMDRRRRRLEEEGGRGGWESPDGEEHDNNIDNFMMDDEEGEDGFGDMMYQPPTAAHLFCLAAYGSIDRERDQAAWYWKSHIQCDVTSASRQQALLELWGSARGEFPSVDLLRQVLETTTEQARLFIKNKMLNLWLPSYDEGIEYILSVLQNADQNADEGGIYGLSHNLGEGKLFVDVGSCLGLTSLAMALLYPGTQIVSIEAAPPNWLVQQINWVCQPDSVFSSQEGARPEPTVVLSGVGPVTGGPQFAPVRWSFNRTTSVRGWSPASQASSFDVEFNIRLTPWHMLLTEAEIDDNEHIDVLNVDCEGCEYNLIPDLDDFEDIPTIMGEVHWGYIPLSKKPSSDRARQTHQRLCVHENFARTAKECCAFPDLPVLSSVPGNILVVEDEHNRFQAGTVRDVAGDLCDDFDTWKATNHLDDIESDWGWFELTSIAADDAM